MAESADIEAKLEALKQKYVGKLGDRVEEINRQWDDLKSGDNWTDALEELITLVHKLAGSAGMYGHRALGEAASVLETALEEGAKNGFPDSPEFEEIDSLVAALDLSSC
jgi:HPt (histidine-containing phosphotransfer) domain-containing protein